jgi:predicted GNAT family acetyltransferase
MGDSVDVVVRDAPERERYEAWAGERLAGFLEYIREGDSLELIHTEVEPEFEGQGVGAALARSAMDEARAAGLRVNPQCPFVARWIARHPEYLDLVPEQWQGRITRATR